MLIPLSNNEAMDSRNIVRAKLYDAGDQFRGEYLDEPLLAIVTTTLDYDFTLEANVPHTIKITGWAAEETWRQIKANLYQM